MIKSFDWSTGTFVVAYHLALLIGLPFYFVYAKPGVSMIVASIILYVLTILGVTTGYHRYYSHRTYAIKKPAEAVLLFFATMAFQGSALKWSHAHRKHHAFTDTDEDPHSIEKGFWYAHVLWVLKKQKPIEERYVKDLLKNPLVVWQHKYAVPLMIGSNVLVCGLIGLLLNDYLGAFVLPLWIRILVSNHVAWSVNSVSHTWGERTYSREESAVDNYILAFLTLGEGGYHNYHHVFPSDFRNGARWYHFDPGKWTIWCLERLGLAHSLKRFTKYRTRIQLLKEDTKLLLQKLGEYAQAKRVELEKTVQNLRERLETKLHSLNAITGELRRLKRERAERTALKTVRRELKETKQSMRQDWKMWLRLCGTILEAS